MLTAGTVRHVHHITLTSWKANGKEGILIQEVGEEPCIHTALYKRDKAKYNRVCNDY